jgi:uncharacterized phosphosugar-binding protein
MKAYPQAIHSLLKKVQTRNSASITKAANRMKNVIDDGGLVYVFGSGHSAILVEEAFHRAGGLIPVYPLLQTFLTPHISPKISGKLERLSGVAEILLAASKVTSRDMIWIASNSGINAVSIEMAIACKKKKIPVVAVTSLAHSKGSKSRHASGKKLYQLCDVLLDNGCPPGDALLESNHTRFSPGSSLSNIFLWNWALSELCHLWSKEGKVLPIYKSANTPDGDEHNEKLEARYRPRIPLL